MSRRSHLAFGFKIKWTEGRKINTGLSIAGKAAIRLNSKRPDIADDIELIAMGLKALQRGRKLSIAKPSRQKTVSVVIHINGK